MIYIYIYDIHVYDIAKLYNVLLVVAFLYAALYAVCLPLNSVVIHVHSSIRLALKVTKIDDKTKQNVKLTLSQGYVINAFGKCTNIYGAKLIRAVWDRGI